MGFGNHLLIAGLAFAALLGLWIATSHDPVAESEAQSLAVPPPLVALPATLNLDEAATAGENFRRLHSLLVSWRGELILERYYNGTTPKKLANIKSASKSVISALVGIAIDRGYIKSVTEPIATFFPEQLAGEKNALKRSITIEDLLTMRSGLETTSNRNYGAWVLSKNWVQHALNRPLVDAPGNGMEYSTGNTHLLSAILTKATGKSTWQFAQEAFTKPLGFDLPRWPQDPQGIYFGGNDMLLTPRQMMLFGEMYLHGGQFKDQQVVPNEWVNASLTPRVQSPREQGRQYGYGWWMRELAGYPSQYAWGYGGQFIFLVPDLKLVVVTTSSSEVGDDRRSHLRTIYDLVEHYIVEPAAVLHRVTVERAAQ
jgi:CubicO group peptidase (beta-lactamase class C family)